MTGVVNSRWFSNIDTNEIYIEQVHKYQCLPKDMCDSFDIMTDIDEGDDLVDFDDWTVTDSSCFQQVKKDNVRPDLFYCETIKLSKLAMNDSNETKIISTTAYYSYSEADGGLMEPKCPEAPVFQLDTIMANLNNTQGSARFILQNSFVEMDPKFDLEDPCNWSCYEDTMGKCSPVFTEISRNGGPF